MAKLKIKTQEDDVLRKVSEEVDVLDDTLLELMNDMAETMHDKKGVGIAAPQVGILKRIIVVDDGENGLLKLINPKIIKKSRRKQIAEEGCLSIPDFFGKVKRPRRIVLEAFNEKGEKIKIEAKGLPAIIFCHEIDHLNGVLFKDKVINEPETNNILEILLDLLKVLVKMICAIFKSSPNKIKIILCDGTIPIIKHKKQANAELNRQPAIAVQNILQDRQLSGKTNNDITPKI